MALTDEHARDLLREIQADTGPTRESSAAFTALVNGFTAALRGFIRATSRNDADADEILNDTWLRFWVALPRYDFDRVPVMAMLKTIALRAAIDYYRRGKRKRELIWLIEDLRAHVERWNDDAGRRMLEEVARDEATPSPQEALEAAETQELLLWTAFNDTKSEPHELIAYGYNAYLRWPDSTLVQASFLAGTLRSHVDHLVEEFVRLSEMPQPKLEAIFKRLRQSVADPDPGDHPFRQCFLPKTPSARIVERWAHNVFRRTVVAAGRVLRARP